MTREIAYQAAKFLADIENASRVLNYLEKQDTVWFGSRDNLGSWAMPSDCVSGARRAYQKLKEFAEAELEKL